MREVLEGDLGGGGGATRQGEMHRRRQIKNRKYQNVTIVSFGTVQMNHDDILWQAIFDASKLPMRYFISVCVCVCVSSLVILLPFRLGC